MARPTARLHSPEGLPRGAAAHRPAATSGRLAVGAGVKVKPPPGTGAGAGAGGGGFIASAGRDRKLHLWDMAAGKLIWTGPGHDERVTGIAVVAIDDA